MTFPLTYPACRALRGDIFARICQRSSEKLFQFIARNNDGESKNICLAAAFIPGRKYQSLDTWGERGGRGANDVTRARAAGSFP